MIILIRNEVIDFSSIRQNFKILTTHEKSLLTKQSLTCLLVTYFVAVYGGIKRFSNIIIIKFFAYTLLYKDLHIL
jgi:hypothetical protein